MIVPMKHLDLLCIAAEKDATLEQLRELGAVHLDLASAQGAAVAAAKGEIADAEKAVRLIEKFRKESGESDFSRRQLSVPQILSLSSDLDALKSSADELARTVKAYAPYGDFDPALAQKLLDQGIDLSSVADLPEKLPPKRLGELEKDLADTQAQIAARVAELASAGSSQTSCVVR